MANERALGMFQGPSHLFPLLFAPKPVVGSVPSAMPSVPAVRVISPVMIVMRMMVIRMMIMMRVAVVAVCVVRMVVHFNRSDGRDRNRGNLLQFLHSSFGRWMIPVYSKPTKRDACPSKMGIRRGAAPCDDAVAPLRLLGPLRAPRPCMQKSPCDASCQARIKLPQNNRLKIPHLVD
jgi:hypothetical protein